MGTAAKDPPRTVDLSGLTCPQVVLRLAERMREVPSGGEVLLVSTDPLSEIDVPLFVLRQGHTLRSQQKEAGLIRFLIAKS